MTEYRTWFSVSGTGRTFSGRRMPAGGANWTATKAGLAVALAVLAGGAPLFAQDDQVRLALDSLVAAYPSVLAGHDGKALRWRDGTVMPVSEGAGDKTFPELLRHASILDQFRVPYPRGPLARPPAVDADPGRFRNAAFFKKMYGDCQMGEVSPRLASLAWLPKAWGKPICFTSVTDADQHLRAVSAEIDALPEKIKRAAYPIAGTYNCRAVADTGQPSPHGYGIAIDLNTAVSDYWDLVAACRPDPLSQPHARGDRGDLREARLHLGREVVSLRYHALRISTRALARPVKAFALPATASG